MSEVTMNNLSVFLATESGRFRMTEPFVRSGWRYYTDGRVAVREKADGEPDTIAPEGNGQYPRAHELFDNKYGFDFKPWPTDGFTEGEAACLTCDGKGRIGTVECQMCDGLGAIAKPNSSARDPWIDCPKCVDGMTGGKTCPDCNGAENVTRRLYQTIGNAHYGWRYVEKILALSNPKYATATLHPKKPIRFRFDGGEGVLMPYMPNGWR